MIKQSGNGQGGKAVKKIITLILSLVIVLSAISNICVPAFALDDNCETGEFIIRNREDFYSGFKPINKELPVKGEMVLGSNTITVNDGCYKFNAAESGYYGIHSDYSSTDVSDMYDVAVKNEENEAEMIVYIPDDYPYVCRYVTCSNNLEYSIFYIEEPGTYYVTFYDTYNSDNIKSCEIDFIYFGELESFETVCDPLVMGYHSESVDDSKNEPDIGIIELEDCGAECCISEVNFAFSGGEKCKGTCYGYVDQWQPGNRRFTYYISNGPKLKAEINLDSAAKSIDRIEIPNKYGSVFLTNFADSEYSIVKMNGEELFWPDYVDVYFKDGSVQRTELTEDGYYTYRGIITDDDGTEHVLIMYFDCDNSCFNVNVEGLWLEDVPVYRSRLVFFDFIVFVLESFLPFAASIRMIRNGTFSLQSVKDYLAGISQLTKGYIDYNRNLYRGNYIPLVTALIVSSIFELFN